MTTMATIGDHLKNMSPLQTGSGFSIIDIVNSDSGILFMTCLSTPPTTASKYARGCVCIRTNTSVPWYNGAASLTAAASWISVA